MGVEAATVQRRVSGTGKVMIKMDIEGAEYKVLGAMLEKGLLCQGIVDFISIEYHPKSLTSTQDFQAAKELRLALSNTTRCGDDTNITQIVEIDDESYLND